MPLCELFAEICGFRFNRDLPFANPKIVRTFVTDLENNLKTNSVMAKKKIIEVYKHPYMFKVEVEFGTFDEMLANEYRYQTWNGGQLFIGGSFNEKMNKTSRTSLIEMAVEFDFDTYHRDEHGKLHFKNVSSPKGIRYSCWEGTYCYCPSWFDEEMKQGLFPVKANWDGVTYIERGDYVNGKYVPRYEKTDTYRY